MRYRIIKRRDCILDKDYYYIEKKDHLWNSWIDITEFRFSTFETAKKQMEAYKNSEVFY